MVAHADSNRFELGQVVATPAALEAIEQAEEEPVSFLRRHVAGDWGELSEDDQEANEQALVDGSRILSAYRTTLGVRLWVITEATAADGRRAATTILLPEEY